MIPETFIIREAYNGHRPLIAKIFTGALCYGHIEEVLGEWAKTAAREVGLNPKRNDKIYTGVLTMIQPRKGSKASPSNYCYDRLEMFLIDSVDTHDGYEVEEDF
jgi:hypothetical protein